MKHYFVFLAVSLFIALSAHARSTCDQNLSSVIADGKEKGDFLKLSPSHIVYFEHFKGNKDKPTLVLLPGINREVSADLEAVHLLQKNGFGILTFATSAHWHSLMYAEPLVTPDFLKRNFSEADFATEVRQVLSKLNIKNPVILSLSYSSSIAAKLDLPVIHAAPMVTAAESDPSASKMASLWEKNLTAPEVRLFRDNGYRLYWTKQMQTQLVVNPQAYGPNPNIPLILEGYTALSRSLEGFDLRAEFFPENSRRFIIADNESQVRLKHQIETFLKAAGSGPTQLIFVRHSEHFILQSQPQAYVTAVKTLLEKTNQQKMGVGVINPKSRNKGVRWLTEDETVKLFALILRLPDSPDSADLSAIFQSR